MSDTRKINVGDNIKKIARNDRNYNRQSNNKNNNIAANENYPMILLESSSGSISLGLRELWEYHELLYFFVWRDIKVRYKQTVLGFLWAIIQPFLTMVVFSLFFGRLAGISSDGIPYPIFTYTALLPWIFFANGLNQASKNLVGNANLITKIYFPRLIIPFSSIISGLLDFAIAFTVLLGMMLFYEIRPSAAIIWLPLFLLLALVTSLGVSLWLSAMNVRYRDIGYIVPFLIQIWLFSTPVAYPSSLLSEPWRTLYAINPMVGVVEGFRWALLGNNPPGLMLGVSTIVSIFLLISGLYYFKRMERTFADTI